MKYFILTTMLLLISCGSLQEQADEFYNLAIACNEREKVPVIENGIVKIYKPKGTCEEEWNAWNEVEERIVDMEKRRALKNGPKCPKGQTAYCNHWCMMDKPSKRQWVCVNEHVFQNMTRF